MTAFHAKRSFQNQMNKILAMIGLFAVIALIWLIAPGNQGALESVPNEPEAEWKKLPEDDWSMAIANLASADDVVLPDDWESVTVADCAHFGPPAAVEQAASVNPKGWTTQQLCAWMLANSDMLHSEVDERQKRDINILDAQFPEGAFDSPYHDFSTAEFEVAAPNDGVASYVLATRLQHIDRERSDELFVQSAMQTGLPGPLMAAVYSRNGVDLVRDPDSGSVVYANPDDVFKAAVLAMTVKHMGYDFHQASFFMEHVAKAMGPDSVNMVISQSERPYEQISLQGVESRGR